MSQTIIYDREDNILADLKGENEVHSTKDIVLNANEKLIAIKIGTKEQYHNAAEICLTIVDLSKL